MVFNMHVQQIQVYKYVFNFLRLKFKLYILFTGGKP